MRAACRDSQRIRLGGEEITEPRWGGGKVVVISSGF